MACRGSKWLCVVGLQHLLLPCGTRYYGVHLLLRLLFLLQLLLHLWHTPRVCKPDKEMRPEGMESVRCLGLTNTGDAEYIAPCLLSSLHVKRPPGVTSMRMGLTDQHCKRLQDMSLSLMMQHCCLLCGRAYLRCRISGACGAAWCCPSSLAGIMCVLWVSYDVLLNTWFVKCLKQLHVGPI